MQTWEEAEPRRWLRQGNLQRQTLWKFHIIAFTSLSVQPAATALKDREEFKKSLPSKNPPHKLLSKLSEASKKELVLQDKECDPICTALLKLNPVLSACAVPAVAVISHHCGAPSQEICCSQNKSDVLPNIQRQKRLHCSTEWLKIVIIMNYLGYFQACIQVKVRKCLKMIQGIAQIFHTSIVWPHKYFSYTLPDLFSFTNEQGLH